MKIYTKTGDKGYSGFIGGRSPKDDSRFYAIGSLDELNAFIGIILSLEINNIDFSDILNRLKEIQSILFFAGALLAEANIQDKFIEYSLNLERDIDFLDSKLPDLKNFILPSGGKMGANLHYLRAISRRTERDVVKFKNDSKRTDLNNLLVFLNRLSDWAFVSARYVNTRDTIDEEIWKTQ